MGQEKGGSKGGNGSREKTPRRRRSSESRSDCFLAFESVFDKVQGCVAGRQQPVRASLRASCAARPSSPPSTRCAREELDEINVFVNVFDKVAPEKPVLANAVAVAALNKTRARSLTRSTCSSPREARQGARLRGRPSAACAGKLAGKLCGQAFEFAFDKVRARGT